MGVNHFLTTSEGVHVPNPRCGKRNADALADAQRVLKEFPKVRRDRRTVKHRRAVEKVSEREGPGLLLGALSFRVYRDPARPDYLLFVEHFADQAAYDAHTGSAVYTELIAGKFADLIVEFVEIDHELIVTV
jgi:quinol monooxygenase YgiN